MGLDLPVCPKCRFAMSRMDTECANCGAVPQKFRPAFTPKRGQRIGR
jgi:hypothetical protein